MQIVDEIYKPGIKYKKSGVMIGDITSGCIQNVLFDPIDRREERLRLSCQLDRLNQKYGLKTVRLAVEGEVKEPWKVKSEHKSGNYLTDINELLTIHI